MDNNIITNKQLSFDSEEFKAMFKEVCDMKEVQKRRYEMENESFKLWLYNVIYEVAKGLGYIIGSFVDFNKKVYGNFKKGFWDGFNEAMKDY